MVLDGALLACAVLRTRQDQACAPAQPVGRMRPTHRANGPGEGGLPPPDSFMVRADAAKRWSVVAAAGGKPSRVGGVTQGRTVGAKDGAIEDFSVRDYTGGFEDVQARLMKLIGDPVQRYQGRTVGAKDGAIEPPWMGSRRVLPWVTPPARADCREAPKRPTRPQSLQSRKTEKPAQGGLFRFLLRRLALPRGLEPLF
ncbi:hypothetical protein M3581_11705 [Stenotrophomonas maltophilia]|nr:hypothetical protein [Stenotrophomonas maltophilia]